jgi:NADH:ubiquinone oxidoreductase subunit F (NADH-binding)
MTITHRVLHPKPIASLAEYVAHLAGGTGLERARLLDPWELIEIVEQSGLRGRGGAGFPTGRKWRTVRENLSASLPSTVVVNGAEGEPGTFKDRTILRRNPYHVLEGALIAAHAVSAAQVVVALKRSFAPEVARVRSAVDEIVSAGYSGAVDVIVFEGPDEYLYGEETALLETLDGRLPFPRISPPFRRGVTEVVESAADLHSGSGLSAHVEMAGPDSDSAAPPALVDNVETLANVPRIIERGASWFRTEGTEKSPGTIVCTITGCVDTPGVGEIMLGTTLREAIDEIGGGPLAGHDVVAVLPGVSSAMIPATQLDTPLTYEDMTAIGSGLGSAGYYVLDTSVDPVAAIAGVSRFLAIESCGQCSPCKQDGLALSDLLAKLARSDASERDVATITKKAGTVADGARCSIGTQQQAVVQSLFEHFASRVHDHVTGATPAVDPLLIAELTDIRGNTAEIDERHATKQPDWTYDPTWRGETPVERFTDHRATDTLDP